MAVPSKCMHCSVCVYVCALTNALLYFYTISAVASIVD